MSVRFVVGRAGSGKTYRCLEAIRARLREDAAQANRLLLIVPEQASFQMERALIETPQIAAFTRCEVLSFQRLAYRVFAETGADPRRGDQTIGAFGRMMVVRRLIRRERANLRLLNSVADKPGLIGQVTGAVEELMREAVQPEQLVDVAEKMIDADPLGAVKLQDVARLYQAYLDYLVGDRIDPAQYLQMAAERLDGVSWLNGAEVWVDGFAGFTRQEYHLLAEVSRRAAAVEITMLVEPDSDAVTGTELSLASSSRFGRAERTLLRIRKELQSRGVEIGEPIRLAGGVGQSRFQHPELARLEACLFTCDGGSRSQGSRPAEPSAETSRGIRVLDFPDRRAEVEAAVAEVQRLTRRQDAPLRYRDIAIVVRDLGAYHDLISAAMRSRGIQCFVDRREPTTHHPLIELVRGLLAVATDDCRLESVRLVLKTGLLPITPDEADLLENYLIAHGIEGHGRWDKSWTYTRLFAHGRSEQNTINDAQRAVLDRVNEIRTRWLASIGPWLTACRERAEVDGRSWATWLFECLERVDAGGKLAAWAETAMADGEPHAADMHRQVWQDFIELLDEFVRALGSEPMRIGEFRETLEAGLAEFNLGLAPPTLDAVLVGAVERSRHPEIRAALLLGFDEAHYPMRRGEDPLLGDAEREAMRQADAEIGPSRGQRLADERMLAYIAMTRASEYLWVSYPRREADGKPLQASAYLRDLLAAVPILEVKQVADREAGRSADWVSSIGQLGAGLAREFRYRPQFAEDAQPDRRVFWNSVFTAACGEDEWRSTMRRCLAGLCHSNTASLDPGLFERAVAVPFKASVSRLESFAACPFKHCAEYWLGLQQRVEAETNVVDLGKVCHAILERFVAELVRARQSLVELEDDEIAERVDRIAARTLPEIADDLMLEDARSEFLLDRSRGHLVRVTRWQRDFARRGRFRPAAVEFGFGYGADSGPVVRLRTPKGREILLRGRIDRVDLADLGNELLGLVIDYKRTHDRRLNLVEVYHGLALQLVGYLLALRQAGKTLAGREIKPVAALYLPLLESFQSVGHPEEAGGAAYQCRGVIDVAAVEAIDETVTPGGPASAFVSAKLNKDGQPRKGCDLAKTAELSGLVDHVEQRMAQLADELIDGNVAIAPYRLNRHMPCGFCIYKPVCRYEIETQPPRRLDALERAHVLEQVGRKR